MKMIVICGDRGKSAQRDRARLIIVRSDSRGRSKKVYSRVQRKNENTAGESDTSDNVNDIFEEYEMSFLFEDPKTMADPLNISSADPWYKPLDLKSTVGRTSKITKSNQKQTCIPY